MEIMLLSHLTWNVTNQKNLVHLQQTLGKIYIKYGLCQNLAIDSVQKVTINYDFDSKVRISNFHGVLFNFDMFWYFWCKNGPKQDTDFSETVKSNTDKL